MNGTSGTAPGADGCKSRSNMWNTRQEQRDHRLGLPYDDWSLAGPDGANNSSLGALQPFQCNSSPATILILSSSEFFSCRVPWLGRRRPPSAPQPITSPFHNSINFTNKNLGLLLLLLLLLRLRLRLLLLLLLLLCNDVLIERKRLSFTLRRQKSTATDFFCWKSVAMPTWSCQCGVIVMVDTRQVAHLWHHFHLTTLLFRLLLFMGWCLP